MVFNAGLMKQLIETHGVSGDEDEVRSLIIKEIKHYVDSITIDELGNVIANKKGKGCRIMLAAHMDEIGLMVKRIDPNGVIYCSGIGGFEPMSLLLDVVSIKTKKGKVHGIITTPEITAGKYIDKPIVIENLIIDTGLSESQLKKLGVDQGSYISLDGGSENLFLSSDKIIYGKALDDRIGCYILLELAKRVKKTESAVFFVFTTQEEVGLLGATTSTYKIRPNIGLAIDTTHADDRSERPARILGNGPCITAKDGALIASSRVNHLLISAAQKNQIPYQIAVTEEGTTDATTMMVTRGGVPSGVISIPIRNIHTRSSVAHVDDIENAIRLLEKIITNPPEKICY